MFNRKSSIAAALLALGTVCAGTAHAANVQWSIGINLPAVGTVISSEPVYQAPPTYYVPAPVYAPAPVYVEPAPVVVYRPVPRVVYRPEPVYAPRYYGPGVVRAGWAVPGRGWGPGYGHGHHDHDRHDDWRDGRDDWHGDRGQPDPRRQHH